MDAQFLCHDLNCGSENLSWHSQPGQCCWLSIDDPLPPLCVVFLEALVAHCGLRLSGWVHQNSRHRPNKIGFDPRLEGGLERRRVPLFLTFDETCYHPSIVCFERPSLLGIGLMIQATSSMRQSRSRRESCNEHLASPAFLE